MKRKKIILLVIFLVAILFLVFYFVTKNNPGNNENLPCALAGESIGTCVGCTSQCCAGLKPLNKFILNGECVNYVPDGNPGLICSNCGNNVCDLDNSENPCNCPEDCKE